MGLNPAPFFMSPKISIPMSLQEMFASWLAQFMGHAIGQIAAIFVMGLIIWLLWWLPWSLITKRSGFRGRRYWIVMHLVGTIPIVAFAVVSFMGQTSPAANAIGAFMVIGLYLGIWLLALIPKSKNA